MYTRGLGTLTASQHNMFDSKKHIFLVLLTRIEPSSLSSSRSQSRDLGICRTTVVTFPHNEVRRPGIYVRRYWHEARNLDIMSGLGRRTVVTVPHTYVRISRIISWSGKKSRPTDLLTTVKRWKLKWNGHVS